MEADLSAGPVEGKDPGEAFSLGVNLSEWIFSGTPLRQAPASTGSPVPISAPKDSGSVGATRKKVVVEEGREEFEVFVVPSSVRAFADLKLPERVTHRDLLHSQAKCPLDDPECILPCPKTDPPFWWRYHRDCRRFKCKGHPLCMLDVLRSQIFLEALNAEKNISR